MMRGLIGKKIGMTQVFGDHGTMVPVTVVDAGPCVVTQVKTEDRDGYTSVQLGFGERKEKHTNKPMKGTFDKAKTTPKRILSEFEPIQGFEYKVGQEFGASIFKEGDIVNVTGTSKGKGFAGVMKRHGFSGGPKTHGQREYDRAPGSIGQGSDPSRVYKGMRMAGHMGVEKVTVRNLEIVRVDSGKNQLLIKGAVPGVQNSFILIKK
ncbi:MAG: 50S ribosomal protein L3 [Candidatus Marinimicrobia bacterium]|nr:50S ribosomal protein L3 [Candidatus Neomarinimicrobiota bacterium]